MQEAKGFVRTPRAGTKRRTAKPLRAKAGSCRTTGRDGPRSTGRSLGSTLDMKKAGPDGDRPMQLEEHVRGRSPAVSA